MTEGVDYGLEFGLFRYFGLLGSLQKLSVSVKLVGLGGRTPCLSHLSIIGVFISAS